MTIPLGTRLGRYEIRSQIGVGGMGEVYLAQDTQLDRPVALKILSADIARYSQRLHRFLQEARAASKLKGANVAHIYEIGEAEGLRFIAMEYVEGEPLSEQIKGRQLPAAEITRIATQIARALEEAHSKGVTSRHQAAEHHRQSRRRREGARLLGRQGRYPLPNLTLDRWTGIWWTPDGRVLSYVGNTNGVSIIRNQPIDASSPIQVTNFKADSILNFFWSHDGKQLVISRDVTNTDIVLIKDFR